MKDRAKNLANDHWDKYVGALVAVHSAKDRLYTHDEMMEIAEFHYKTASIHGHGHGVEDERNRMVPFPIEVLESMKLNSRAES